MEAPGFVHKIHAYKLWLLFDILLLLSTRTEILQALGNLSKLFGVGIKVSVYSTWQKRCPNPQNGLLGSTEMPGTKMQGSRLWRLKGAIPAAADKL